MKRITINLSMMDGTSLEIDAWQVAKVFAVHKEVGNKKAWSITHIPTNYAVQHDIPYRKDAIGIVEYIAKLMDWNFSKAEDVAGRPGCQEVTEYLFPGNDYVTPSATMATPYHTIEELEKFKGFFGVRMPVDCIGSFDVVAFDYWLHDKQGYKEDLHGSAKDFVRHHWGADAYWFLIELFGGTPKNPEEPKTKIEQLAQDCGYLSVVEMLEENLHKTMVPAICMEDGCNYSTDMEKDQTKGWCEICEKNNVQSCFEIEGLI